MERPTNTDADKTPTLDTLPTKEQTAVATELRRCAIAQGKAECARACEAAKLAREGSDERARESYRLGVIHAMLFAAAIVGASLGLAAGTTAKLLHKSAPAAADAAAF